MGMLFYLTGYQDWQDEQEEAKHQFLSDSVLASRPAS